LSAVAAIEVLEFWFSERARALWFDKDPAFDDEIRSRFGSVVSAAASGALDPWMSDGDGALALTVSMRRRTSHHDRPERRNDGWRILAREFPRPAGRYCPTS